MSRASRESSAWCVPATPRRPRSIAKHPYYDPDSDPKEPRWYSVDIRLERRIEPPITLETLRKHAHRGLKDMVILRRGNRLSVTPISDREWRFILTLA